MLIYLFYSKAEDDGFDYESPAPIKYMGSGSALSGLSQNATLLPNAASSSTAPSASWSSAYSRLVSSISSFFGFKIVFLALFQSLMTIVDYWLVIFYFRGTTTLRGIMPIYFLQPIIHKVRLLIFRIIPRHILDDTEAKCDTFICSIKFILGQSEAW